RAVADDLPHHRFLSAQRILRQFGTVERARQLRLGMTDAARLIEQPHAQKLLVVEGWTGGCLLREDAERPQRKQERQGADAKSDCHRSHRASSRHRRFTQAYDRARRKGSAQRRLWSATSAGLDTVTITSPTSIGIWQWRAAWAIP